MLLKSGQFSKSKDHCKHPTKDNRYKLSGCKKKKADGHLGFEEAMKELIELSPARGELAEGRYRSAPWEKA